MVNGFFLFVMQSASRNCHHHRILQLLAIKLKKSVSMSGCIDSFSIKNDCMCVCYMLKLFTLQFCFVEVPASFQTYHQSGMSDESRGFSDGYTEMSVAIRQL